MIGLSVKPGDGGTSYYGKRGDELQSNVGISDTKITGSLKYVDGYSTFDQDTSKHHLVLALTASDADKIETKMTGGSTVMKSYVTVDDGYCVYSVTDKDKQKIYVRATKGKGSVEKVYDLSGLTLEQQ